MCYLGDFEQGDTVRFKFNTHKLDQTAITLAGSPAFAVYKDSSATESTSGITHTIDFDSRTGLHQVVIDTSSDATFYSIDTEFDVVITSGTVDGTSVANEKIASFSINNRVARSLEQISQQIAYDWVNGGPWDTALAKLVSLINTGGSFASITTILTAIVGLIDTEIASILSIVQSTQGTSSNANDNTITLMSDLTEVRTVASRLGLMLQQVGSTVRYQFTEEAVENCPTGSGGGGGSGGGYPGVLLPPYPTAVYMVSDILTYADLVYRGLEKRGIAESARHIQQMCVAVQDAYDDLSSKAEWKYYNRRLLVRTSPVETFTDVDFDFATMTMTLNTGTWPDDAVFGDIVYNQERFKVLTRVSDTEITISSATSPARDLDGITIKWMRSTYTLPYTIRQVQKAFIQNSYIELEYLDPSAMVEERRYFRIAGNTSFRYSVRASENYIGTEVMELSPVPSTALQIEVGCLIYPRPMRVFEFTGTDGVKVAGSATFTSAAGGFTTNLIGCLLRVSTTNKIPIGQTVFNPDREVFSEQAFIIDVPDENTLTLASELTISGTGKGFAISDIADINRRTMLGALEALVYEKFCHNGPDSAENLQVARGMVKEEMAKGLEADATMYRYTGGPIDYADRWRLDRNVKVLGN